MTEQTTSAAVNLQQHEEKASGEDEVLEAFLDGGNKEKRGEDEDEEDDDEGEEEDDLEDEDEVEPKLKYERMGNDLQDILTKDAASCIAVHEKFIAIGTHWGVVHVLDHQGNNIQSKEFSCHTTTVNQINLDQNGDYMSSCSDDGRVAINGLYTFTDNQQQIFDRPIKSIALDPKFSRPNSGKVYVTGGDKLVLHEKGWLNRLKSTVIHQGEGPIRCIQWKSHFIAWANDKGVKMYDMSLRRRITSIPKDHDPSLRSELYKCNLCWKNDVTLLIGWANTVKICVVKEKTMNVMNDSHNLPNRYVQIVAMFTTDFAVCGMAPLKEDLVILSYISEGQAQEDEEEGSKRPRLRIITPTVDNYKEVSCDMLSIRGFKENKPSDYHLEYTGEDNLYYILSPKDVVVAKLRDLDDHVTWLIDHNKYEEALVLARTSGKNLRRHNAQQIGKTYINHLMSTGKFKEAARMCVTIYGKSKELWETEVYKFHKVNQLKAVAPFVPRGDIRLSKTVYEMILNEFLQKKDYKGFHDLIREWSSDLYDHNTIVNAVDDRLKKNPNNSELLSALAELYTHDRQYDKALSIFLRLKHKDVFGLIHKHGLFNSIQDKIVMLVEFEPTQATTMLLENLNKVPLDKIVKQLEVRPDLLFKFLDQLFSKDHMNGQEYHALMVKLYADFDRPRLLYFLKSSHYYPLQGALEICEQRDFIPEMVYLLGHMGNLKKALGLITVGLQDVDKAIDFAKEHNDQELWEDLIEYSMDKPVFITGLLNNIGTHVDPIILIKRIEEGLEIPGLRDSLVKILQDYNLQTSLREGCKKILVYDSFALFEKLHKAHKKGVRLDEEQTCEGCHGNLIVNDAKDATNIAIFFCRHAYHEDCLPAGDVDACNICNSQKRTRPRGSSRIFRL